MCTGGEPSVTEQTRFLGGLGLQGQETVAQPPSAVLFHGDLTGSTMLLTDGEGAVAGSPTSYTAFGEQVWRDPNSAAHVGGPLPAGYPRYAYAGAYGYESGPWGQDPNEAASPGPLVLHGANPDLPPITLMHVGARWYQPGIGRFVQRDPIGIDGGVNLYAYVGSCPTATVDSDGLGGQVPEGPRIWTGLPRDCKGWIEQPPPPGMRFGWDPVTRTFKLLPKTPAVAKASICVRFLRLLGILGKMFEPFNVIYVDWRQYGGQPPEWNPVPPVLL